MSDEIKNTEVATASAESNKMALIMHILTFFIGVFSPAIFYFIKGDDAYVKEEARKQLNVQILVVICTLLFFLIIPIFLAMVLFYANVIIGIIAAINNKPFKPFLCFFEVIKNK